MNSKKLIKDALNHKTLQRIPMDFGTTGVTGIHVMCVAQLRKYYGLEKIPVKVHEPYQMLGLVEEDLKQAIGVDVDGIFSPETMFGFRNENWQEFETPWKQTVLVSKHFITNRDEDKNLYIYPGGDTSVPPSGKMPAASYFFDSIIRQQPIDDSKLNVEDNLEEFGPLSGQDLNYYAEEINKLQSSNRAIIANFGGTALGDIALVPAPFLKNPKGIRDITEWYMSTLMRQDYIHKIFERQCEIALENLQKIYDVIGNSIDAVFLCGTDFGTQSSTFCSPETFRSLYLPYYKQINDWIHTNTNWKTFKHSCGAIEPFIPLFIEAGFDILNPVQCSAAGMNAQQIKDKYGDQIVFWGGGVDTQQTLPFGTPEQVREQVLNRCEIFSENGGFVFNTVHNIQANTPVENIVAMIDAVREFRG